MLLKYPPIPVFILQLHERLIPISRSHLLNLDLFPPPHYLSHPPIVQVPSSDFSHDLTIILNHLRPLVLSKLWIEYLVDLLILAHTGAIVITHEVCSFCGGKAAVYDQDGDLTELMRS